MYIGFEWILHWPWCYQPQLSSLLAEWRRRSARSGSSRPLTMTQPVASIETKREYHTRRKNQWPTYVIQIFVYFKIHQTWCFLPRATSSMMPSVFISTMALYFLFFCPASQIHSLLPYLLTPANPSDSLAHPTARHLLSAPPQWPGANGPASLSRCMQKRVLKTILFGGFNPSENILFKLVHVPK